MLNYKQMNLSIINGGLHLYGESQTPASALLYSGIHYHHICHLTIIGTCTLYSQLQYEDSYCHHCHYVPFSDFSKKKVNKVLNHICKLSDHKLKILKPSNFDENNGTCSTVNSGPFVKIAS